MVEVGGYLVFACALRSSVDENRSFDLNELAIVEVLSHCLQELMAHEDIPLHAWTSEIKIAILETSLLVHRFFDIDLEWRRFGFVQDLDSGDQYFDRPCWIFFSDSSLDPWSNFARNLEYPLWPDRFRGRKNFPRGILRIKDDLSEPVAVAEIDEDESSVIAPAMHPATERYFCSCKTFIEFAAGVGT